MGKRKFEGRFEVWVDFSKLSVTDLEWLRSGIDSALEARSRGDGSGRRTVFPKDGVEVILDP